MESLKSVSKSESSSDNVRQSSNWDISNIFRNYFYLVFSQAAIVSFSFASIWLITHHLGTEEYGGIVAIITASQLALLLVSWTSTGLIKFGVEEFIQTGYITKSFQVRTFILIPNLILVLATSVLWYPPLSSWLKLPPNAFGLIVGHILANALWLHIQNALQSIKLLRLQNGLLAAERILIFIVLLSCVLSNRLSWTVVILSYISVPLLMGLVGVYLLRNFISLKINANWLHAKEMVLFSLPLLPTVMIGFFSSNYIDAIFIVQFVSVEHLGIYSIISLISTNVVQLLILANTLLLPLFVSTQIDKPDSIKSGYFQNILPCMMLLIGIFCAAIAISADYLLPLILGDKFNEVGTLLWILLAACVYAAPSMLGYVAVSNAASATKDSLKASVASNGTNLLFNFILIPRYGLVGCALSTAAAYVVFAVIIVYLTNRRLGLERTWNFQAPLPITLSVFIHLLGGGNLLAFTGCLIGTALITAFHLSNVQIGFNQLRTRFLT